MWRPENTGTTPVVGVTGFICRAADMSPVGNREDPHGNQHPDSYVDEKADLACSGPRERHGSVAPLLRCTHTVTDAWGLH
ncbi:hypothetical protein OYC64_002645 [Pagothenia borchgrevinki]|uniref:Uncharacterized protein n=1 Tax=Pagothenia borchgrevinki TaxID=8213 RepID=A0ABD2HAK5_PAGBO